MTELERLLADLVAIDSVNPDLVPGAAGEGEIASFVAGWLRARGLEVRTSEVAAGRPNVVAVARGKGGGRTLLLNGHLDTVGIDRMPDALAPRIAGGRLHGRGAYDMKGGVAACMLAVARARELGLAGDVVFTGVVDEEHAGQGSLEIAREVRAGELRADGAIVAEPTELELAVAHKGFVWLEVETRGVAAHGSRPHLGVDAIAKMGRVLVELGDLDRRLQAAPVHRHLGGGSVHASLIAGGQELSSYPERCLLAVERRTIPGQTGEQAEEELAEILRRIAAADPAFAAELRRGLVRSPLETPDDHPLAAAVQRAAEGILGRPVVPGGVSYWSDAATLSAAGIPTVLFGPLGTGAHAAEEWVDLESVARCVEVYLAAAREFCG